MFTAFCISNSKEQLNSFLLPSLKNQTREFNLCIIDNTGNRAKSAASEFNKAVRSKNFNTPYFLFAHQDVALIGHDWLEKAEMYLNNIENVGIAGVAGVDETGKFINEIFHGNPSHKWLGQKINAPIYAQTLDECLFIIPKDIFIKYPFDENVCDDWHLYAVDYALKMRLMNYQAYVLPLPVHHNSTGAFKKNVVDKILMNDYPNKYYSTLTKLQKKYGRSFKKIYTTCGTWDLNTPLFIQKVQNKIIKKLSKQIPPCQ